MRYLLMVLTVLMLSGCTDTVVKKVYVDANGTEISQTPQKSKYYTPIWVTVCDERGYAYQYPKHDTRATVPMFENQTLLHRFRQVMCKDL